MIVVLVLHGLIGCGYEQQYCNIWRFNGQQFMTKVFRVVFYRGREKLQQHLRRCAAQLEFHYLFSEKIDRIIASIYRYLAIYLLVWMSTFPEDYDSCLVQPDV